jgi:hypothetical protein
MRPGGIPILVVAILVAPGAARAGGTPESLLVRERPASPGGTLRLGPGPKHRVLYLNRHGGTFTRVNVPDGDNSSTNQSYSLVIGAESGTLPPLQRSEAEWQEIRACVENLFAPYSVTITEEEPPFGSEYIECNIGGDPSDLGMDSGVGGVSGGPTAGCEVNERGVTFVFDVWGDDLTTFCAAIAQELGHSFGLDHSLNCLDPMTYQPYCGPYAFQNSDDDCGEDTKRDCYCSGPTQNSHRILLDSLGPTDHVAPTVQLDEPGDGAAVTRGQVLRATAADDVRVDRVEFVLDGAAPFGRRDMAPYTVRLPDDVALGEHTLTVRAVDGGENATEVSIEVTVVPQCEAPVDCGGEGYVCDDGRCLGAVGVGCELHGQCQSGTCFHVDGPDPDFCTQACSAGSECPSGFDCRLPESGFGGKKCLPASGDGGGCAASPGRAHRAGVWAGVLALVALAGLRKRRAR